MGKVMKKYIKVVLYVCVAVIVLAAVGVLTDSLVEYYALETFSVNIRRAVLTPVCAALVGGLIFVKRHCLD